MTLRHLSASSEIVIFLDTIGSTVLYRLVDRRRGVKTFKPRIVSGNGKRIPGCVDFDLTFHPYVTFQASLQVKFGAKTLRMER